MGYLFIEGKVEVSKYYIVPSVGINASNFAKLHFGYSFSNNRIVGKEMKGFTFSLIFSFGTSAYHGDYAT